MKNACKTLPAGVVWITAVGLVHAAGGAAIPVYDATEVALYRYAVIQRIGVEDWRSALGIGGHPTLDAARNAVLNEAARAGADAVVNLTCFDRTDRIFNPVGYFCYGNAVRVKQ